MVQHVDICVSCMIYKYTGHFHYLNKAVFLQNRGLYTYYFPKCPYVVKLSYTIAFQDWRLSTGSIPAVAVTSLLMSLLMSSDVRIFAQFGSLPKRHQPKRRTNEKVSGAQEKGVGGTAEGCKLSASCSL